MMMLQNAFANVGPFFILLGILIFVHELGHFLVAKYFGVRVEVFSLGFGKKLLSFQKGETTYCLSLIPLGGYVKMFGDDPSVEVTGAERDRAFLQKPVGQRIAIVLAGPLMNLFFAVLIFVMIAAIGEELPGPVAGDIAPETKAYEMGFRSGDRILTINSEPMPTWNHVRKRIEKAGGSAIEFTVERANEPQPLTLPASVAFGENENIFNSNRQVGHIDGLSNESRSTLIGIRDPKSPAAQAGLVSMELITAVDGRKVSAWRDLQGLLLASLGPDKKTLNLQVRDLRNPERPEAMRTLTVNVPEGWNEKTDLPAWLGLEPAELYIYQVKKDSPADRAGLKAGDKVVRVNDDDVVTWNDVLTRVKGFDPASEGLLITIFRDGQELKLPMRPELTKLMSMKGQEERRFTIGIVSGLFPAVADPVFYRAPGVWGIFEQGLVETRNWTEFVVMSVVRLVQGDVSAKNIGGVISIGRVASHSFAAGLSTFLRTMAIISINLFLLNLLPIPILDGGHLVFYSIEGLRGTPLSMRKMELAQQVGLMLLMFLMVFAFFNDITNIITNRW